MADEQKSRKGFTVSELESKAKKYGLEICLCFIFILTTIFTLIWGGAMILWSILLTMLAAIVGVLFPLQVKKILHSSMNFAFKEKVTYIALGVIGLVISILLPVAIFALAGVLAGKSIVMHASASCDNCDSDK